MKTPLFFLLLTAGAAGIAGAGERYLLIDDPGNPASTVPGGPFGHGRIDRSFWMGKWEVTDTEWTIFLQTIAIGPIATADPHGLWDSRMGSDPRGGIIRLQSGSTVTGYSVLGPMSDKPVNFVTYYDALRYCNWLHHGQSSDPASTETGAYTMNAAAEAARQAIPRNPDARFFLPTIDEWYKGGYYDPFSQDYSTWPVGDFLADPPTAPVADGTGEASNRDDRVLNANLAADWNGLNGNVLGVGACGGRSFFGLFDMGGNVCEWTETPGLLTGSVIVPGGAWDSSVSIMSDQALTSITGPRNVATSEVGFRVAAADPMPEFTYRDVVIKKIVTNIVSHEITLTVPSQIGCSYRFEASINLKTWSTFPGSATLDGHGGPLKFTGTLANPAAWFRVVEF